MSYTTDSRPIEDGCLTLHLEESVKLRAVAKALSSDTRQRILKILHKAPSDVSGIAAQLGQTEANVSAQVVILQKAELITCHYEPGEHGVRKVCTLGVTRIEIDLD